MKLNDISLDRAPEDGLENFLEDFTLERFKDVENLKKLHKSNNIEAMREITHRLKGFCAPYGFNTLEILSDELNCQIKKNSPEIKNTLEKMTQYLLLKKNALEI